MGRRDIGEPQDSEGLRQTLGLNVENTTLAKMASNMNEGASGQATLLILAPAAARTRLVASRRRSGRGALLRSALGQPVGKAAHEAEAVFEFVVGRGESLEQCFSQLQHGLG